jgi:UDP-2,3-diacylglucosamine pyrophosphatase LpxH
MHYRTIVISDIHLWTAWSKYKEAMEFLKENTCDHLILNWDIIDWRHIRLFWWRKKWFSDLFKFLFDLEKQWTKITYIKGNHDEFRWTMTPIKINNIEIVEDLIYKSWAKKYYICHWQQFDKVQWSIFGMIYITLTIGTFFYRLNRKFNELRKKLWYKWHYSIIKRIKEAAKLLMLWSKKKFEININKIINEKWCDGIICGHLHKADDKIIGLNHYLNSWDRIESMTALVEDEKHNWKLIEYKK